jgi:hypothetical protein
MTHAQNCSTSFNRWSRRRLRRHLFPALANRNDQPLVVTVDNSWFVHTTPAAQPKAGVSQTQLPHRFGSSRARRAEFRGREPHLHDPEFVEPFQN